MRYRNPRAPLRFPRTLDAAFNTPRYATAVTYYTRPSLLRRIVSALRSTR